MDYIRLSDFCHRIDVRYTLRDSCDSKNYWLYSWQKNMTKLWLILGLVNLLAAAAIFIDQVVRFNVWWEWDELFHHEPFFAICFYAALILFIVALVEYIRNLKRRRM
jgi:hypothetical protein